MSGAGHEDPLAVLGETLGGAAPKPTAGASTEPVQAPTPIPATPVAAPAPGAPQPSQGIWAKVKQFASGVMQTAGQGQLETAQDEAAAGKAEGGVLAGMAVGAARGVPQAAGGVLDLAHDLTQSDAASEAKEFGLTSEDTGFGHGNIGDYLITQNLTHRATAADILSARDSLGKYGSNEANQATANIVALTLGGLATEGSGLTEALPVLLRGAANFGTSAFALGGSTGGERFSNALQALGVHTEFTDWLAAAPAQENGMMARFKNALDGSLTALASDAVFKAAKWAYLSATPASVTKAPLVDGAKVAADQLETSAPDLVGDQPQGSPMAARGTPEAISEAHQEAVAAAEKITPEAARPSATIQTQAVSGRASASGATTTEGAPASATGAAADANKVTFRIKAGGSSSDTWRDVGTMDKGDLQRFYDQAAAYSGKTAEDLDVTEASAPELHQGIGQIKLAPFNSPDDVPAFFRAVLDNSPAMARPMSDVDLNKQVALGAASLGLDRNAYSAFLQNFAGEAKNLPQAVGISRAGWQSIVQQVSSDAKMGLAGLTDEDLKGAGQAMGQGGLNAATAADTLRARLETVMTARAWGAHILDIKAGLGRGLRAWQLPAVNAESYFQKFGTPAAFDELPEGTDAAGLLPPLPRNLKELDNFYKLWAAAGDDDASRANLLQGKNIIPSAQWYARNALANFYTGSLLAGKAIVKGYVMPSFMGALQTFERTSGAGLAMLNPMLSAEDRATFGAIAKSSGIAYGQTFGDFVSSFRYSIDATKNGGNSIIGGGYSAKDASQRMGPVTDEMLQAAGKDTSFGYQLGNALNVWPRAVFSLVGGHDELTKRLSYLGRIRMTAMVSGSRAGVHGQDLIDYVNGALADAVDPSTGAATHPDILNEAARTAFMNSPQTSPMAATIKALNSARSSVPELRYILPVLNVPASGLGEGIRRLPIVSAAFSQTRDDLLGNNGQIPQAEAYGRWITGATLLGTGFGLARHGLLTGGGPQNPANKAQWENNGYQPYSIKVDGHWVSYKDWEPVGSIFGVMGTMHDHTVHYAEDDQTHNKVLAATAALAEYAKDKAAMQSVSELLNFGDPQSSQSYFKRLIGGTLSGFEPASVKYIRNAMDPDMRAKGNWYDYMLDGIPGESKELMPIRNVFGEPIHSPNDAYNLYGLLPLTISSSNPQVHDSVTEELDKVYQLTGYAGGIIHPTELSNGYFDTQTQMLENGRSMFDQFTANRLEPDPEHDNMTVKERLKDLFASDDYQDAKYGSATKSTDAEGDPSKLKMIANVFKDANTFSKQKMAQDSPIAKRYLAVAKAKSDSPDLLRTHTADELAGNPPLLKSLGINLQDYESKAAGQ